MQERPNTGVDGNRTHQEPRQRPLNGFEGRGTSPLTVSEPQISGKRCTYVASAHVVDEAQRFVQDADCPHDVKAFLLGLIEGLRQQTSGNDNRE